jgi:hypothetical protein
MAWNNREEAAKNYQAPEGYIFLADIKSNLSEQTLANILKGHPCVKTYRLAERSLSKVNSYKIEGLYELIDSWTAKSMHSAARLSKIKSRAKRAELERERARPPCTIVNVSEVFARVAAEMRAERERFWG